MMSSSHNSLKAECEATTVGQFQFISIQTPDDAKDHAARRLARSHAVKHALRNKRKTQQDSMDNFRVMTSQDKPARFVKRRMRVRTIATPLLSPSIGKLDPFQTLAVDCSRLQALLNDYAARQAPEPVFSVSEELAFQSFSSVFRTGLVDPALLSAVMLSLAFAVAGHSINRECLGYQGQAIGYVRERMSSLGEATSESTIGAILLLAGVEACLGMTSQVQLHMGAVRLLLKVCQTQGIFLTSGIKRAIFWQDLNSSVLAGSSRIVDHTTFSELQWTRDPLPRRFFRLSPGFQMRSHLFPNEFLEVLEDLHALQCIRNIPIFKKCDTTMMARINNHTAFIQSKLMGFLDLSPAMSCCRLAAYLCSAMLCCRVWCSLVIPPHVSSQLLREIQMANDDPVWDDHPDLLLWLLFIGGAFAPAGVVRSNYIVLLRLNNADRFGDLYESWSELLSILKQFTWSEKAFMIHFKAFWEEASSTSDGLARTLLE
ncbi:hypothetical protein F4803DRAFT_575414 [Xylaria telfairii]|nr:hypothetical protein F4803DRAFT_575414 [Xylaria telfairii]